METNYWILLGTLCMGAVGAGLSQLGWYTAALSKIAEAHASSGTPMPDLRPTLHARLVILLSRAALGIFWGLAVGFYFLHTNKDYMQVLALAGAAGYVGDSVDSIKAIAAKISGKP